MLMIRNYLKKLQNEIWKFRIQVKSLQIRLLVFWDKRNEEQTLVISTHGFIKKTERLSKIEIEKAINDRKQYFENQ